MRRREVIVFALPKTFKGCTHAGYRVNAILPYGVTMEGRYGKMKDGEFVVDPDMAHWDRRIKGREYREGLLETVQVSAAAKGAADLSDVHWRRSDVAAHLLAWGLKDGLKWEEENPVPEPEPEAE